MDLIVHKLNVKLLDNISASSGDYETEPFNVQSFSLFSIHHDWTNVTNSGTKPNIEVYGSNNLNAKFVALGSVVNLEGTSASLINFEKAGFAYIKIIYRKNNATGGTISTYINAKVI